MSNSKENLYLAIISEMSIKTSTPTFTPQVTTPPSQPFIIRNPNLGQHFLIFKMLFDFGFYVGIIPFKFVFTEDGSLTVCSCRWRRYLNKVLFILWICGYTIRGIAKISSQPLDVITYFNCAHVLLHIIMLCAFYVTLFSNQWRCFEILKEIDRCTLLNAKHCRPIFLKVSQPTNYDIFSCKF